MKQRKGFVSNSSSASFIVHWRMKTFGKEANIEEALNHLYEAHVYDRATNGFVWDGEWATEAFRDKFEALMKITNQNDDGSFTTTVWTSMMNSYEDLGEEIQSLVFALVANDSFVIVDTKLNSDGM